MAGRTCPSQNVQSTTHSDHFLKLRCQKMRAIVARNVFPSLELQSTAVYGPLLKVQMSNECPVHMPKSTCAKHTRSRPATPLQAGSTSKKCTPWFAKHMSKSNCAEHARSRTLLEFDKSKTCTQLWREAHVEIKMLKAPHIRTAFRRLNVGSCRFAWQAQGIVLLLKKQ